MVKIYNKPDFLTDRWKIISKSLFSKIGRMFQLYIFDV